MHATDATLRQSVNICHVRRRIIGIFESVVTEKRMRHLCDSLRHLRQFATLATFFDVSG